jgi:hypothetical protein
MPATFLDTATTPLACPLPLTTVTLPEPANELDLSDAKGAVLLPARITDDAIPKPEQEPPTPRTIEIERAATSAELPTSGETSSDTASEARGFPTQVLQTPTTSKISARKNPIAIGIAASVLIAAVLGGAWHVKRGSSIHESDRPFAASAQSRQPLLPAATQPSQSPASRVAKGGTTTAGTVSTNTVNSGVRTEVRAEGNNGGAIPAQTAQKTQEEAGSQQPGDALGQLPPAKTDIGTIRESNSVADSSASVVPTVEAISSTPGSESAASGEPKLQNSNELSTTVTVPAKIVSQPLPSIPSWAKALDTDAVVQLDALIDEKGSVAQTHPRSGPHALQRVAEQAVALWIFEPALSDGKPTATHMVLTVQFQR